MTRETHNAMGALATVIIVLMFAVLIGCQPGYSERLNKIEKHEPAEPCRCGHVTSCGCVPPVPFDDSKILARLDRAEHDVKALKADSDTADAKSDTLGKELAEVASRKPCCCEKDCRCAKPAAAAKCRCLKPAPPGSPAIPGDGVNCQCAFGGTCGDASCAVHRYWAIDGTPTQAMKAAAAAAKGVQPGVQVPARGGTAKPRPAKQCPNGQCQQGRRR